MSLLGTKSDDRLASTVCDNNWQQRHVLDLSVSVFFTRDTIAKSIHVRVGKPQHDARCTYHTQIPPPRCNAQNVPLPKTMEPEDKASVCIARYVTCLNVRRQMSLQCTKVHARSTEITPSTCRGGWAVWSVACITTLAQIQHIYAYKQRGLHTIQHDAFSGWSRSVPYTHTFARPARPTELCVPDTKRQAFVKNPTNGIRHTYTFSLGVL